MFSDWSGLTTCMLFVFYNMVRTISGSSSGGGRGLFLLVLFPLVVGHVTTTLVCLYLYQLVLNPIFLVLLVFYIFSVWLNLYFISVFNVYYIFLISYFILKRITRRLSYYYSLLNCPRIFIFFVSRRWSNLILDIGKW